jgi:dTDP-glucose 4,6-dehydratase
MKYLITGGAGFIGNNFIKYMLNKYPKDYFVCLDLLTYASSLESLEEVINQDNFKFVHGDICDQELVDKLFAEERFDYVVNFAAESHVDRSFLYEDLFYKTNVLGTKVLLEASLKYNVRRFHQVSTDEVYGSLSLSDDISFTEESPINPTSPYSKSKALADMLVLEYFNKYNLSITISRSSNNYGIYQHPEKLIPKIVKMALNGEEITVYGDGSNVRDWLYVVDHCQAIDLIINNGKSGEIYNVAANYELPNIQTIKMILDELNIKEYQINYTNDRPNDDTRYSLDCSKIKQELNWNLRYDFNKYFKYTVNWFKENIDWIERILSKENR